MSDDRLERLRIHRELQYLRAVAGINRRRKRKGDSKKQRIDYARERAKKLGEVEK